METSGAAEEAAEGREYRTAELAEAAGITVRTLRFYRERKLLPAPRREGRIAWYDEHHLARLRTIAAMLERGHTLGGIAELLAAFDKGRDVGELLGLESEMAGRGPEFPGWSQETPVRLSPEALADYFTGEVTPENLAAALDLGYVAVDGDEVVHVSRRLLDASSALVDQGVPLATVLSAAREVRAHVEALAALFTDLVTAHVRPEAGELGATIEQLRPVAGGVVEAELSMAMDRRLRAGIAAWLEERARNA
ncbi:MerR family transcriptional regulator [Streptomyces pathocidini]|uniref:MerR family transcriptional regulator n=1 Tax=Streptomyces pathocidini TaxID=1650571 RepID=A0ABW7USQ1_9ACTN|nr:MerR family transcriptional regulator [Streptomyces pathocidini]